MITTFATPVIGASLLNNLQAFFSIFVPVAIGVAALAVLLYLLRLWFRQLDTDLPLVALNISRVPLLTITIALGLKLALNASPELLSGAVLTWLQHGLSAIAVIVTTYWIAQILTQVAVYFLRQYADQTEAMWDDVLIPLMESILPIITYIIGGLLFLQTIGLDLTGLLVALGGAAFILGFALKDILANFFSGLVLLIDTPFRFGDVVLLPDNSRAIIKNIGLRVTNLYLIDNHSEIYIPNGKFQDQSIVNLSRPTTHYYYAIDVPIRADVDPTSAIRMMEDVVLAHPDTMGEIDRKLEVIDQYYGLSMRNTRGQHKREAGRQRLIAEKNVILRLGKVEEELAALAERIAGLEQGGLTVEEARTVQGYFLQICELVGLEARPERDRQKRIRLIEISNPMNGTLIEGIRAWYQSWLQDPDLIKEDRLALPREWEQKVGLLKLKVNKLYGKISAPLGQETRLDDAIEDLREWMQERFKSSRNEWQDPKIWLNEVKNDSRETVVRFYVDNIKLEHCERGNRVKSEVYREMIWHLRQAYLCH